MSEAVLFLLEDILDIFFANQEETVTDLLLFSRGGYTTMKHAIIKKIGEGVSADV